MYRLCVPVIIVGVIMIFGSYHMMIQKSASYGEYVRKGDEVKLPQTANNDNSEDPKIQNMRETAGQPNVTVIVLADESFQEKYNLQIETIHCYTARHGLDVIVPTHKEMDKTQCSEKTFYLRRHCLLSRIMETYPEGHYFVLLDADTIAFDLSQKFPLEEYLSHDLVFYERWWNGEVQCALGVRNKVS